MGYKTFDDSGLAFLRGVCGAERVTAREAIGADFCHDELGGTFARPDVRVRVTSTDEVSRIKVVA